MRHSPDRMIDLHLHSTASDGSDAPAALAARVADAGLSAAALTDHDTVAGVPAFLAAARRHGFTGVAGVELSVDADVPDGGHMHLLGLLIDPDHAGLRETLARLRQTRETRAYRILERLAGLGIAIDPAELDAAAGEGSSIGRPHIARLLIRHGVVASVQEGFDRFLGEGCPAFVDKEKLDEASAIRLVHAAGGLAVLAHPQYLGYPDLDGLCDRIRGLMNLGLDGVEVYYPGLPADMRDALLALAREAGLVVSGGSDYHGAVKPDTPIGAGEVPDSVLEAMHVSRRNHEGTMTQRNDN